MPNSLVRDYKTGGRITVHIAPHSHDDVGWLKTVDEYFDGSRKDLQEGRRQVIVHAAPSVM